jgi:hypothetical protein
VLTEAGEVTADDRFARVDACERAIALATTQWPGQSRARLPRPQRARPGSRGCPAAADPTPARALAPLHDRDLPTRNLLRGDHLHSPRPARADDARQRRPRPIEHLAGARHALRRAAPADQACPRVGPAITQNNGPTGNVARSESHGCSAVHPHASIPTSRRRSFLPCLTRIDPRRSSRSVSVSESASLIRSPARHSTTISPLRRLPYRPWRAGA